LTQQYGDEAAARLAGLQCIQPHGPVQRQRGVGLCLPGTAGLQGEDGAQGLPRRAEDGQRLVAAQLEHLASVGVHPFAQRTANRLHRYDCLPRQPKRFLVLGDAVCAFNPVYGQGMTVAALAALELARCLREQRRRQPAGDTAGLARHFQQQLARSNAPAWLMATGEDLRYPTTEGARPDLPTRLMHRYVDRVIRVATQNQTVNRTFFNAMHMLTPPTALFRPAVLLPTLLAGGRPGLAGPPLEAAHGGMRAERATAPLVS
jgi:2-polyprenyl-6-methoxyphenol hydroxylase-like FAD-dependent oxidoreductase